MGLVTTISLLLVIALWGYYPGALERTLRVVRVDRHEDTVYLDIRNTAHRRLFMGLNAGDIEIVNKKGQVKTAYNER